MRSQVKHMKGLFLAVILLFFLAFGYVTCTEGFYPQDIRVSHASLSLPDNKNPSLKWTLRSIWLFPLPIPVMAIVQVGYSWHPRGSTMDWRPDHDR